MGVTNENRYVCDRCKIDNVRRGDLGPPPGWVNVDVKYAPDFAAPERPGLTLAAGMVCVKCRQAFHEWWTQSLRDSVAPMR